MREVRTIDGHEVTSHEAFRKLLNDIEEPLLLKGAPLASGFGRFTLEALKSEFGALKLPDKAQGSGQGKSKPRTDCAFTVADQKGEEVMGASAVTWNPAGCSFEALAVAIAGGSGHYLTTRSGKATCRRAADALVYEGPTIEGADDDVLIRAFVPRVPSPLLLPCDKGFQTIFWVGAQGNNFGLHSDLFSEQFLVQYEGTKEVFLSLPRDASLIAPFPYLSSPLFYKSERRSVQKLGTGFMKRECVRAMLSPGDVLYIPPWWWHEVRTVSPGVSVSATFRFHTEDADRFSTIMRSMYSLNQNAAKRDSSGRLAQHLRSYFAYGLAVEEAGGDSHWLKVKPGTFPSRLACLVGVVGAAGAFVGFVAGRFSRWPRLSQNGNL